MSLAGIAAYSLRREVTCGCVGIPTAKGLRDGCPPAPGPSRRASLPRQVVRRHSAARRFRPPRLPRIPQRRLLVPLPGHRRPAPARRHPALRRGQRAPARPRRRLRRLRRRGLQRRAPLVADGRPVRRAHLHLPPPRLRVGLPVAGGRPTLPPLGGRGARRRREGRGPLAGRVHGDRGAGLPRPGVGRHPAVAPAPAGLAVGAGGGRGPRRVWVTATGPGGVVAEAWQDGHLSGRAWCPR